MQVEVILGWGGVICNFPSFVPVLAIDLQYMLELPDYYSFVWHLSNYPTEHLIDIRPIQRPREKAFFERRGKNETIFQYFEEMV